MQSEQFLFLLTGAWGTVKLSLLTFAFGGALGLLVALGRVAPSAVVRRLFATYIMLMQGTPLIVLMGVCYFGPSLAGIGSMSAMAAAAVTLTIYSSAFLGEIWRACIQAVPKSQWEAAECLGLSSSARMGRVILPQALRMATPPSVGFLVQIIKNTSIASLVVGYAELSYNAKILNNSTFQPFLYFGCAVVLYFLMCYPLSRWSRTLERRLNASGS